VCVTMQHSLASQPKSRARRLGRVPRRGSSRNNRRGTGSVHAAASSGHPTAANATANATAMQIAARASRRESTQQPGQYLWRASLAQPAAPHGVSRRTPAAAATPAPAATPPPLRHHYPDPTAARTPQGALSQSIARQMLSSRPLMRPQDPRADLRSRLYAGGPPRANRAHGSRESPTSVGTGAGSTTIVGSGSGAGAGGPGGAHTGTLDVGGRRTQAGAALAVSQKQQQQQQQQQLQLQRMLAGRGTLRQPRAMGLFSKPAAPAAAVAQRQWEVDATSSVGDHPHAREVAHARHAGGDARPGTTVIARTPAHRPRTAPVMLGRVGTAGGGRGHGVGRGGSGGAAAVGVGQEQDGSPPPAPTPVGRRRLSYTAAAASWSSLQEYAVSRRHVTAAGMVRGHARVPEVLPPRATELSAARGVYPHPHPSRHPQQPQGWMIGGELDADHSSSGGGDGGGGGLHTPMSRDVAPVLGGTDGGDAAAFVQWVVAMQPSPTPSAASTTVATGHTRPPTRDALSLAHAEAQKQTGSSIWAPHHTPQLHVAQDGSAFVYACFAAQGQPPSPQSTQRPPPNAYNLRLCDADHALAQPVYFTISAQGITRVSAPPLIHCDMRQLLAPTALHRASTSNRGHGSQRGGTGTGTGTGTDSGSGSGGGGGGSGVVVECEFTALRQWLWERRQFLQAQKLWFVRVYQRWFFFRRWRSRVTQRRFHRRQNSLARNLLRCCVPAMGDAHTKLLYIVHTLRNMDMLFIPTHASLRAACFSRARFVQVQEQHLERLAPALAQHIHQAVEFVAAACEVRHVLAIRSQWNVLCAVCVLRGRLCVWQGHDTLLLWVLQTTVNMNGGLERRDFATPLGDQQLRMLRSMKRFIRSADMRLVQAVCDGVMASVTRLLVWLQGYDRVDHRRRRATSRSSGPRVGGLDRMKAWAHGARYAWAIKPTQ